MMKRDREIQEGLYDPGKKNMTRKVRCSKCGQMYDPAPKKRKASAWLTFVIAHKHMKNSKGGLDFDGIGKLWQKEKEKYRPHIILHGVKKKHGT